MTYLDFIFLELFEFIDFASNGQFLQENENMQAYVNRIRKIP